jgi:hypothetical protein
MQSLLALTLLTAASGFSVLPAPRLSPALSATPNAPHIYAGKYHDELIATATTMVGVGKGLLACDESTGTVGTRLEANGMENTEQNRQKWRNLLFTTPGLGEYVRAKRAPRSARKNRLRQQRVTLGAGGGVGEASATKECPSAAEAGASFCSGNKLAQ